jgi:hypothetical protein
MPRSIKDLRADAAFQYYPPVYPAQAMPPQTPKNVTATGKEGYILIQWNPNPDNDGYEIAVSSDRDMAAPDQGYYTVSGGSSSRFSYPTGNVVLTRFFAVRAFQGGGASALSGVVSAASALTDAVTPTGAAEPTVPPPEVSYDNPDQPQADATWTDEDEWRRWH